MELENPSEWVKRVMKAYGLSSARGLAEAWLESAATHHGRGNHEEAEAILKIWEPRCNVIRTYEILHGERPK